MSADSLVNVERLLDDMIVGAEEGIGSCDVTNAAAREAVRLLLDVARSAWRDREMNALLAFDASLAEEKS